jgi:hypothetical protein
VLFILIIYYIILRKKETNQRFTQMDVEKKRLQEKGGN